MGLDMYAIATPAVIKEEVDFSTNNVDGEEIKYWRKHPNLHGWMEELYYRKGGTADSFNCVGVVLTEDDLDKLEDDIINRNLPHTSGFFFGVSDDESIKEDLEFIKVAKRSISDGMTVYYTSWW